ncbi:MAG TPA: hypothetical protein VLI05_06360 [Candidatus Saccharimonadia bacterium]|nr:hypothetical protein [Candidatus Saccharimonadia bacterium]
MARYLETRRRIHLEQTNLAADVMRHLHARQHLGTALIVCEEPAAMMALAHKQWLKIARILQRRRLTAISADDILKYTHTITHMQHMSFVTGPPHEEPGAQAYFVRPNQLRLLPANCLSVYLTTKLSVTDLAQLLDELPPASLLVDYLGQVQTGDFGLKAKAALETKLAATWQAVELFLEEHEVKIEQLAPASAGYADALDNALDILLDTDEFLQLARTFQYALDLARPLRNASKPQRDCYDAFVLLAHHVQALTPGAAPAQFLKTYADDTFFLHDAQHRQPVGRLIAHHQEAGRYRLARALMQALAMPDRPTLTAA